MGHSSPLFYALNNHKYNAAKLLIENGANIDAKTKNGDSLTDYFATYNKRCSAKLLIAYGATINRSVLGNLMMPRCNIDHTMRNDYMSFLLDIGADVNYVDCETWTPLIYAT